MYAEACRQGWTALSLADLFAPERFGGSERVALELSRALVRTGVKTGILAGGRNWAEPGRGEVPPVWRYRVSPAPLPALWLTTWHAMRRVQRLPLLGDGGVLLLHHPISAWAALKAGHWEGRTCLALFYGPVDQEWGWQWSTCGGWRKTVAPMLRSVVPKLLARLQVEVLRKAHRVVTLGTYTAELVETMAPGVVPRIIPPGVDLSRFSPPAEKGEAKAALGLDPAAPVVLTVRRLEPRMGVHTLLEAVAMLQHRLRGTQVVVVGTGTLTSALRIQAARAGLGERVHFVGRVADEVLPAYYKAADVFALPSRALEGFGLVTLEALASGVPVVATSVGESPHLLGGSPVAAVVPPDDPGQMAAALERFLLNPPPVEECRAWAQGYSWTRMARDLITLAEEAGASP